MRRTPRTQVTPRVAGNNHSRCRLAHSHAPLYRLHCVNAALCRSTLCTGQQTTLSTQQVLVNAFKPSTLMDKKNHGHCALSDRINRSFAGRAASTSRRFHMRFHKVWSLDVVCPSVGPGSLSWRKLRMRLPLKVASGPVPVPTGGCVSGRLGPMNCELWRKLRSDPALPPLGCAPGSPPRLAVYSVGPRLTHGGPRREPRSTELDGRRWLRRQAPARNF